MAIFVDLPIGSRHGSWTTTSLKYKRSGHHHYSVDVVCDCGTTATIYSAQFTGGRTARCVKCGANSKPRVDVRNYVLNAQYQSYKNSARKRNLDFELTKQDFAEVIFKNCYYCSAEPKNRMTDRTAGRELPKYSGIDRVDNRLGYVAGNIVPCCRWCNEAKKAKTIEEWDAWIEGLIQNYHRIDRTPPRVLRGRKCRTSQS